MRKWNKLIDAVRMKLQRYNPEKYWKYRKVVIEDCKRSWFIRLRCLHYIKKCDAFNNASLGTNIGEGATFKTIPHFPHGLNGIIISKNAKIGANAVIFHQVTIGEGNGGAPVIGDNCYIGAGAKIIGGIHIGNNVRIGANCIVSVDVPDNATVVMEKPRIIIRKSN